MSQQLAWSNALNIGQPEIDAQHRHLFAVASSLMTAVDRSEGEYALKETFDRLKAYTRQHFKDEEAYMREIGHPDLEAHSDEHALLMVRVDALWRLIQNGENISAKSVALFISDWITGHIMQRDAAIGDFVRENS